MRVRFSLPAFFQMKNKILVIVGPTAVGKSALAVRLAKKLNGEIISADSRQVYTGLDVGTGKITKQEMKGVPHHLIDVASPRKQFTAAEYRRKGLKALKDIMEKKHLPIVVGGTGFYIDALTGKIALPDVAPNKPLRKVLEKKNTEELFRILKKKDPHGASTIARDNKVHLIRALEIVKALGKVPGCQPARLTPYQFVFIGIKPSKKELEKRIRVRLIKRLPGIIREVQQLNYHGLTWKRMYELGLEYRYVSLYLQGKTLRENMVEKLYTEIRHYAKRQMTWFRRNKKIKWFKPAEFKKIVEYARMTLLGSSKVKSE